MLHKQYSPLGLIQTGQFAVQIDYTVGVNHYISLQCTTIKKYRSTQYPIHKQKMKMWHSMFATRALAHTRYNLGETAPTTIGHKIEHIWQQWMELPFMNYVCVSPNQTAKHCTALHCTPLLTNSQALALERAKGNACQRQSCAPRLWPEGKQRDACVRFAQGFPPRLLII